MIPLINEQITSDGHFPVCGYTVHRLQLFIISLIPELSPLGNQSVIHHYLSSAKKKAPRTFMHTHSQTHTGMAYTQTRAHTPSSADTLEMSLPTLRY